jgi:hypothetical protein
MHPGRTNGRHMSWVLVEVAEASWFRRALDSKASGSKMIGPGSMRAERQAG